MRTENWKENIYLIFLFQVNWRICLYEHLEEKGEWISYKHIGMPGKEFHSALPDFFLRLCIYSSNRKLQLYRFIQFSWRVLSYLTLQRDIYSVNPDSVPQCHVWDSREKNMVLDLLIVNICLLWGCGIFSYFYFKLNWVLKLCICLCLHELAHCKLQWLH